MPFPYLFAISGGVILGLMITLWLLSLCSRNASIIDIAWGIIFLLLAWLAFALTPQGYLPRKLLICRLVTIWGLRLALHVGIRNRGKPEDFRYANWRAENGERWQWLSLFQVFLLQGFLVWIISAPILAAQTSGFPAILTPMDLIGTMIWLIGFVFETVGDLQLMLFKANPANQGKLLTTGLWRFTRHPNYFGDAVLWWGFYIIALAAGEGWTIFSPILMTFLLIRVSRAAMLEQHLGQKPGYKEYVRATSAFLPWFPKKQ